MAMQDTSQQARLASAIVASPNWSGFPSRKYEAIMLRHPAKFLSNFLEYFLQQMFKQRSLLL